MTGVAILLAAVAATCNAAGDLLQRRSARSETSDLRGSFSLVGRLLRQKAWLAGVVVSLAGLCIHVTALSLGELATVQPVLVAELPLAVLGSAFFFGRRLAVAIGSPSRPWRWAWSCSWSSCSPPGVRRCRCPVRSGRSGSASSAC